MQHISALSIPQTFQHPGGRIASEAYRHSLDLADEFAGLEEGVDRYDLLLLVKKVGKQAGFTPRMIQLLDYYFAFTREIDWEEGSRPIIYQSISRTALDLGVSERQIQKLEKALFDVGAITWNDSGNHRRFGQRDPESGRIRYAFGVELTPLASLQEKLKEHLEKKQIHDAAWMEAKRQISWYRRQIRAMLSEIAEEGTATPLASLQSQYDAIALQIRSHINLDNLNSLLSEHRTLHSEIKSLVAITEPEDKEGAQRADMAQETHKGSSKSEQEFVHYKSTTQQSLNKFNTRNHSGSCFQGSVVDRPTPSDVIQRSGVHHVNISMALEAASEQFEAYLPFNPEWPDVIEAAYRIKRDLGISQNSWGRACELLGRTGAALCVLLTDRARARRGNPVRSPAAYFNGMLKRAERGELHLHKSIFGLVKLTPETPQRQRKLDFASKTGH